MTRDTAEKLTIQALERLVGVPRSSANFASFRVSKNVADSAVNAPYPC